MTLFTNELEDAKAAAIFRLSLGQKVSAVCQRDLYGHVTGHRIDVKNRIVLTGTNENGDAWQSVKPKHIF